MEPDGTAFTIAVGDSVLEAEFADNAAAAAFRDLLEGGPMTVSLREYGGFEKVGQLPSSLPTEDAQITAKAGDIMLYQGNQVSLFYGSNSWSYTPLGRVDAPESVLAETLGDGDVEVVFSLAN